MPKIDNKEKLKRIAKMKRLMLVKDFSRKQIHENFRREYGISTRAIDEYIRWVKEPHLINKRKIKGDPEHHANEFYQTPHECVLNFLQNFDVNGSILDCCAGDGAFARGIEDFDWRGKKPDLLQIEIRESESDKLLKYSPTIIADYLKMERKDFGDFEPSIILSNPPFSKAVDFIQHSQSLFPEAVVAFFLRLGFMASLSRKEFLNANPPSQILVIAKRPKFYKNQGMDDYGFFVWGDVEKKFVSI